MINRINIQFLISYLGFLPFVLILFDKFFLSKLEPNIMKDFVIFYSLIILVFIGALNWDLKKNISTKLVILGFMPSILSVIIIFLFLYSYEVFLLIIICFLLQLIFDNYIYKKKFERYIYYKIRIPLTLLIVSSLFLIQ
jgi:hypothetical protein